MKPVPVATARVREWLRETASPAHAKVLAGFFKTGPGEYGEGDRFLGLRVPAIRRVVPRADGLPKAGIISLLKSAFHEERVLGFLILVRRFERAAPEDRKRWFDLYMSHRECVNNWDLVDLTAPRILGAWLLDRPRDVLDTLVVSPNVWERRMAVLATFTFLRHGEYDDLIRLATRLLDDPHDLMHKACGWMLREAGKRNLGVLIGFLERHCTNMPRTMLRYAIEKLPERERKAWLAR